MSDGKLSLCLGTWARWSRSWKGRVAGRLAWAGITAIAISFIMKPIYLSCMPSTCSIYNTFLDVRCVLRRTLSLDTCSPNLCYLFDGRDDPTFLPLQKCFITTCTPRTCPPRKRPIPVLTISTWINSALEISLWTLPLDAGIKNRSEQPQTYP